MTAQFTTLSDTPTPTRIASTVIFWDAHKRIGLQLRDALPGTPAPGQWGTFGGEIEPGETPLFAAIREIHEEIGTRLSPTDLTPFAISASPSGVRLYGFICTREIAPADITLGEGAGFAFLTREQIETMPILPAVQTILHHFFKTHPTFG